MKRIPTECYSRVVGYFRPVQNMHEGKLEEYKDRKPYKINENDLEIDIDCSNFDYAMFTRPGCTGCELAKDWMKYKGYNGIEFNVLKPQGQRELERQLNALNEEADKEFVLPVVVWFEDGNPVKMEESPSRMFQQWEHV